MLSFSKIKYCHETFHERKKHIELTFVPQGDLFGLKDNVHI